MASLWMPICEKKTRKLHRTTFVWPWCEHGLVYGQAAQGLQHSITHKVENIC
jgi:hypothetical protein